MPKVKLNDVEIYYEEHGQGRPMVFLSETACDGEVWKINQVGEFSKDHRVIIHDYRGTGQSSKPSTDYTTRMFAQDVVALMDHLGAEDAIIVGHSMGGRVAQFLALDYPKKVHRLILASTGAHYPQTKGLPLKICKEMIEWGYEKYEREHTILVGWTEEYVKNNPEKIENYLKVRMHNLCPVEFYLRHLTRAPKPRHQPAIERHQTAHADSRRRRRPQHDQRNQSPNVVRDPGQGHSQFQARGVVQRAP